jgi:Flp pilus assembly protein TadG
MRSGAITREEFKQRKQEIRTQQANAQAAMAKNAADQVTQGRNPYTSGEGVVYDKEMSGGKEGSDTTILSDEQIEERGLANVDDLINKDRNPDASIEGDKETRLAESGSEENPDAPVSMRMSAIGQYGFKNLKFGRRKK